MNERIKELAEQAGFVVWDGAVDWASNYDDELERFAELVRADEREAEKPWVKSYCGGKPNYTTPPDDDIYDIWVEQKPVRTSDMSEKHVHESDEYRHEYVIDCPRCGHCCPEREWVGLTPTEFNSIKDSATTVGYAMIKTEAMLKEKNGG